MYAYSGDRNDRGQYLYYGKTGGCVITGNEDGAKACSMEILYALSHIGFVVPPQADCAWLGEAGPGPSYGDVVDGENAPAGYENDFTNRNATIMSWNLMHTARLLEDMGGFPVGGNVADDWQQFANAGDMDPDAF
jgi:multimeric flavodoxin WrbA